MTRIIRTVARVSMLLGAALIVLSIVASPPQMAYGDDGTTVLLKDKDNTCSNGCTGYSAGSCTNVLAKCDAATPRCDEFYCDADGGGCSCYK